MQYQAVDLVFAKVKGLSAWPVKITWSDVLGGVEKNFVVFYGKCGFQEFLVLQSSSQDKVFAGQVCYGHRGD